MAFGDAEINNRFGPKPVDDPVIAHRHEVVRQAFHDFATFLDSVLSDNRGKSTTFTKLQQTFMWAKFSVDDSSPGPRPVSRGYKITNHEGT